MLRALVGGLKMASFDYPRIRATAARLIAKFGQTGAIRRTTISGPAYDPETVITDHACQLAVMQYTDDKIDGTLIMRGDKLVYLSTAGLSIEPSTADKVVIGGEEHAIVNVKPLSPAGLVVFWEVQARR
ncbi:hypothetical protein [Shinella sp.]|uniref:hypothetical protein n=1 Tax=Shinella sp. TaxID=1870904 RepID=UPI0028A7AB02|nr:hypothetical protein [Shinella sp.]